LFAEGVGDPLDAFDIGDGGEAAIKDNALVGLEDGEAGDVGAEIGDFEGGAARRRSDDDLLRDGGAVVFLIGEEGLAGCDGGEDNPVGAFRFEDCDGGGEDFGGFGIVQRTESLLADGEAVGGNGRDLEGLRVREGRGAAGEQEGEEGDGSARGGHVHDYLLIVGGFPSKRAISAWISSGSRRFRRGRRGWGRVQPGLRRRGGGEG